MPLVTIVALCHNHAPFLREALDSILSQTHPSLEVWLVDDASTDDSAAILREYAAQQSTWHLLLIPENVGNCRAFNQAFFQSRGEFVIDFATDDVLLPARVAQQVAAFAAAASDVGVVYSNAELVAEDGKLLGLHHRPDAHGNLLPAPASGWVFGEVLRRYFISTPTMMMRRACLQQLGGYDETLAYEDFDFWVRASRQWQFLYLNEVTTRKRIHPRSMSSRAYRRHDPYLASTIKCATRPWPWPPAPPNAQRWPPGSAGKCARPPGAAAMPRRGSCLRCFAARSGPLRSTRPWRYGAACAHEIAANFNAVSRA
ncbi:hypothetical protein BEN47_00195 [Hymenobacter lapidarius]|uniref:Glycosyltransferase 2-like domain-containing protein n=1 Tax=Hymenobacter lapidarius TaxID=1908237 RepID=A0A1G1T9U4_9BACT|nr:hypothetical protein BEN47_00195 [Hymenobacter lapidarius]